jgi:hypothetical protein
VYCVGNIVLYAAEKDKRSDVGMEPSNLLSPMPGQSKGFDKEVFEVNQAYVFQSWRFKGAPNPAAEPAFQAVAPRRGGTIWHRPTALWVCKDGEALLCAARLGGSAFPSHRMWHDQTLIKEKRQKTFSALWCNDPNEPDVVAG